MLMLTVKVYLITDARSGVAGSLIYRFFAERGTPKRGKHSIFHSHHFSFHLTQPKFPFKEILPGSTFILEYCLSVRESFKQPDLNQLSLKSFTFIGH